MIALLAALLAVVQSPYSPPSYACDGVTAVYTVPFPYLTYTDLLVTSTTVAGIGTTLTYTTDYTVNLASTSSTATLTLNSPATKCPSGNTLKIARNTALTQPTSFKAQTTYNQTLHEQAYDRAVMEIQQTDAKVSATDVKAYVDAAINSTLTGGTVVSPITWALAGDGSATAFSIPNAVVSNADLYEVTIDGLVQRPTTDYTINLAGAQVVFTTAPALNALIVVRSLGYAKATSVGGATTVLATGSTTTRTLADWLADIPNVIAFGADKAGIADSTAAFNAAWLKGDCVFVPAGTYRVNLLMQSMRQCIIGIGESSILKAASSALPVIKILSSAVGGTQIFDARIQDVKILGLGTGEGLHLEALTPYVITESNFSRIAFDQLTNSLVMVNGAANELYLNRFDQLTSKNTAGTSYIVVGAYNHFTQISAVLTSTKAWDESGMSTYVYGLTTDGIIRGSGQNGTYHGINIEVINGTPSGGAGQGALQFVGYGYRLNGVTLTNVDNAKTNYGLDLNNGPHWITGFRMWGTLCPQYPVNFGSGSLGGVIDGVRIDTSCTPANFKFEQYTSDTILQSFGFRNIDPRATARDYSTGVVSADRGDTSQTLTVGVDLPIQRWATALTANRTITLSATGALNGSKFRVVRTGLGAFNLDVGGLKTIVGATAAFVDVVYDGAAWRLAAYGPL